MSNEFSDEFIIQVGGMEKIYGKIMDEERALYGKDGLQVIECIFEGPADGESAIKECKNVEVKDTQFKLRYPMWHDTGLKVNDCILTETCRAPLWYSKNIEISNTVINGVKALRECENAKISGCSIESPEFGWNNKDVVITDSKVGGEYLMMNTKSITFKNVKMTGKYSFQYIEDSLFENCDFDTKDAFWHAKNVVVKNCRVKGEYLAWYCENVTFDNCTIIGTQPLCYCKGLKLINCKMIDCDLSFEKSDVEATVIGEVESIKNPRSGKIVVDSVKEIIMDDEQAKGVVEIR